MKRRDGTGKSIRQGSIGLCKLAATGIVAIAATVAQASNFAVVDPAGNGDFTDIQSAITHAQGRVVRILAGDYEGPVEVRNEHGAITLVCESPDKVRLRNVSGVTLLVGANATATIRGCSLIGGEIGVGLRRGGRAEVVNSVIAGNLSHGIFNLEDSVARLRVLNSTIAMNGGSGIQMFNYRDIAQPYFNAIESWEIAQSIIFGNLACGIDRQREYTSCCDNQFPVLPRLRTNNVHQNFPDYCNSIVPDVGSRSELPGFLNAAGFDFRLRNDSTSRNQGHPSPADADPDGTRNDLGAYGGPGAAGFFPSSQLGPTVPFMDLDDEAITAGAPLRLRATGRESK